MPGVQGKKTENSIYWNAAEVASMLSARFSTIVDLASRRRQFITKILFFVYALFLGSAQAQELKKIKIGYPQYPTIKFTFGSPRTREFTAHGLDVEVIFFRGGQMATQALSPAIRRSSISAPWCRPACRP